jgi:hypothetical protein
MPTHEQRGESEDQQHRQARLRMPSTTWPPAAAPGSRRAVMAVLGGGVHRHVPPVDGIGAGKLRRTTVWVRLPPLKRR